MIITEEETKMVIMVTMGLEDLNSMEIEEEIMISLKTYNNQSKNNFNSSDMNEIRTDDEILKFQFINDIKLSIFLN